MCASHFFCKKQRGLGKGCDVSEHPGWEHEDPGHAGGCRVSTRLPSGILAGARALGSEGRASTRQNRPEDGQCGTRESAGPWDVRDEDSGSPSGGQDMRSATCACTAPLSFVHCLCLVPNAPAAREETGGLDLLKF